MVRPAVAAGSVKNGQVKRGVSSTVSYHYDLERTQNPAAQNLPRGYPKKAAHKACRSSIMTCGLYGLIVSPSQPETDAVIGFASPKPTYAVLFLLSYVYTVYQARMKLSPRMTEFGSPPGMIALMHSVLLLPSELGICAGATPAPCQASAEDNVQDTHGVAAVVRTG